MKNFLRKVKGNSIDVTSIFIPNWKGLLYAELFPILRNDRTLTLFEFGNVVALQYNLICSACGEDISNSECSIDIGFYMSNIYCPECSKCLLFHQNYKYIKNMYRKKYLWQILLEHHKSPMIRKTHNAIQRLCLGIINTYLLKFGYVPNLQFSYMLKKWRSGKLL